MHTPRNIHLSYVIEPVASNQLPFFLNQMNNILNVSIYKTKTYSTPYARPKELRVKQTCKETKRFKQIC